MKYPTVKKIFSSFLLLAVLSLVYGLPNGLTKAQAMSEVSGTLSTGSTPTSPTGGAGSTSSGGTAGGSSTKATSPSNSTASSGSVLGASTSPVAPTKTATRTTAPSGNVTSDGTALSPSNSNVAVDYSADSIDDTSAEDAPYQNTAAATGAAGLSAMSWFWIIVLLLIIGSVIGYIYKRNKRNI